MLCTFILAKHFVLAALHITIHLHVFMQKIQFDSRHLILKVKFAGVDSSTVVSLCPNSLQARKLKVKTPVN